MSHDIPWLTVYGFGAHIKSTQKKLIILNKGVQAEYPLEEVRHLLVVGGHILNSSSDFSPDQEWFISLIF